MKRTIVIVLAVLFLAASSFGQQQPPEQTVSHYKIFVFLQAASAPENKKAEDAFRAIVDDFQRFLKENRISVAEDMTGRNWRSELQTPLPQVLDTAKHAGAASVLYSTVTLPGKTVGIKTTAYALDGNEIWTASAGCDLETKVPLQVCVKVTMETLREALKYRVSQQDLPVIAEQAQK